MNSRKYIQYDEAFAKVCNYDNVIILSHHREQINNCRICILNMKRVIKYNGKEQIKYAIFHVFIKFF